MFVLFISCGLALSHQAFIFSAGGASLKYQIAERMAGDAAQDPWVCYQRSIIDWDSVVWLLQ